MKIKHVDDIKSNKSPNIIMVYCRVCRILSRFENELKTPLIAMLNFILTVFNTNWNKWLLSEKANKKVLMFYI